MRICDQCDSSNTRLEICGAALVALALLLWAPPAHARAPETHLSQLQFARWGEAQGLPQTTVQAIAQTPDGYLWLATQGGLARFDGIRFTTFDRRNTQALPANEITTLVADSSGGLMLGTTAGGLVRYENGRFSRPQLGEPIDTVVIRRLLQARDGALWIGTADAGLFRVHSGKLTRLHRGTGLIGNRVTALAEDASGHIWVGTSEGLSVVENTVPRTLISTSEGVFAVSPAADGAMWVGTTTGRVLLMHGTEPPSGEKVVSVPAPVQSLRQDASGALWIGTNGAGLFRFWKGELASLGVKHGMTSDLVWSLFEDREENLWVGTNGGGLTQVEHGTMVPVGVFEGLSSDVAISVLEDKKGGLWVGTAGGGLNLLEGHHVRRTWRRKDGLPQDVVVSLAEDAEGAIWIGMPQMGIARITDGAIQPFGPAQGLSSSMVHSVFVDQSGALWVGTLDAGLQRFRPGPPLTYTVEDGLPSQSISALAEHPSAGLWVGTTRGLVRLQHGRIHPLPHPELKDAAISALHADPDGTLWIAILDQGLARLRDGTLLRIRQSHGLHDEVIHRVLDDGHGHLWMSSNSGIFRVAREKLDAFFEGQSAGIACDVYGIADGMRSREANGGTHPAGVISKSGTLWFPTISGVVAVDPASRPAQPLSPVLEEVRVDGVAREPGDGLHLEPQTGIIEIRFTAPHLSAPERVRFRYRLTGHFDEWRDAREHRVASFSNLPPGRSVFEVQARLDDQPWSTRQVSLALVRQPRLTERWGFWASVVLAGGAGLAAAALVWMRRVRRREQELLSLIEHRTRAEERYRELFDNAMDAVFTTDLDGQLLSLNHKAQSLLGVPGELHAHAPRAQELLENVTAESWRSPRELLATRVVSGPAAGRPLEVSTRLIHQGELPVAIQAIARDVSERAFLEAQLRQSQRLESIGKLAGGVAHDFNNLLTVIRANVGFLQADATLGEQSVKDLEEITAATDRAVNLTRQLLAFGRQQLLQPCPVDLNASIAAMTPMLRRLTGEDVQFAVFLDRAAGCAVCDPSQLEQIILNLVVNARDAMPKGGTIELETSSVVLGEEDRCWAGALEPGRYALVKVTDTGHGIPKDIQARIFEPFFTTKEVGKGTGLGLSTVYGIVQQSGGQLRLESTEGKGTTFSIYLPWHVLTERDAAVPEEEEPLELDPSGTVMVVEDEEAVRVLTCRMLRRRGYTVLEARHGADALLLAQTYEGTIDLLLSDVVMPLLCGPELAEQVQQMHPGISVVWMSGYTDDEMMRRGMAEQRFTLLQKPFSNTELLSAVRAALFRARSTDDHTTGTPGGR